MLFVHALDLPEMLPETKWHRLASTRGGLARWFSYFHRCLLSSVVL